MSPVRKGEMMNIISFMLGAACVFSALLWIVADSKRKPADSVRRRIAELLLHDRDDLMDCLNVKDAHPVLRSVLTIMEAKCQAHLEAAAVAGLSPDEAKAEARCSAAMQEVQEIILETAEEARKANA